MAEDNNCGYDRRDDVAVPISSWRRVRWISPGRGAKTEKYRKVVLMNELRERISALESAYIRHLYERFTNDPVSEFLLRSTEAWEARRPDHDQAPWDYIAWEAGPDTEDYVAAFIGILGDFMEVLDKNYCQDHRLSYDPYSQRFCIEFDPNRNQPT